MSLINKKILAALTLLLVLSASCGEQAFLEDAVNASKIFIESSDIIIVSGGTVAQTSSPYPLHQIHVYANSGVYKGMLYKESSETSFLMGAAINSSRTGLLYTIENIDRVDEINFSTQDTPKKHILDANLSGTTLRAIATLSDGSNLIAESTTSIEKYDHNGIRVTTNFPIVVSANIMKVRALSGNRFALVYTGGNDSVSIRNNDGTAVTTITSGLACGTNCDPTDIVELPDGRFVVSYNVANVMGLYLYSSSFSLVGTLYANTSVINSVSSMATLSNGDILACSSTLNVCERFSISGNTASRVGSSSFISDAGRVRQPTDVVVVP